MIWKIRTESYFINVTSDLFRINQNKFRQQKKASASQVLLLFGVRRKYPLLGLIVSRADY